MIKKLLSFIKSPTSQPVIPAKAGISNRVYHIVPLLWRGARRAGWSLLLTSSILLLTFSANASTVVATLNSIPITDADINARMALMRLQSQPEKDLHLRALMNIMEDLAKIDYANQFKITPTKTEIEDNIKSLEKQMGKDAGFLKSAAKNSEDQLNLASAAHVAWQKTVFQVYAPQVSVSNDDIERELESISVSHGLPVKITLITDGTCKDSDSKITVEEQELDITVRQAISHLKENEWSSPVEGRKFMVCARKKNEKEYANAKTFAENQATFKRALFDADQQLKAHRRRAVINILDNKYKKVLD